MENIHAFDFVHGYFYPEMMSMVMSQNMQLQQMMLQQMISSSATNRSHAAENRIDHHR